jgi:uroporphyrinogen III methyltransferase/synthase
MLTDREYSSQVAFITGHEADGKRQSSINWNVLAKFGGSIVFYMGMGGLQFITEQLMKNGMNKETPAAVIANATFPNQRITKSTVEGIDDKCKQENIGPPAIVVIGDAAVGDTSLNWFMKKPLFGRSIVATRDSRGNDDFAAKVIHRAGNPVEFPTIKIEPLTNTTEFLQVLAKFTEYNWIIFTSANGVRIFFDYIHGLAKDARVFASAKIAAIGAQTAAKLADFGIRADFVPDVFTGKDLGTQLIRHTNLHSKKVLLLRSRLASNELIDILQQAGAEVDNVPIYTAITAKTDSVTLTKQITDGAIDWLTFASPSSVTAFFEQIRPDLVNSGNVRVASIGPVTSEQLKKIGVKIDLQAAEHTIDGLLGAIEENEKHKT